MTRTLWTYSLIAGSIHLLGWLINGFFVSDASRLSDGEFIGYGAMLLSFIIVFFGIKKHRGETGSTKFSATDGFKAGMMMVLLVSFIYTLGWELYRPLFMPDFYERYFTEMVMQMEQEGVETSELEIGRTEARDWIDKYNNPLIRIPMSFAEIFPFGLILNAIFAFVLRKKGT